MTELLTIEDCAARAKCSPRHIRRQILAGKLKPIRLGSLVRIRATDWEEYLCRSGATEAPGKPAFSLPAGDLAALLRIDATPTSGNGGRDRKSKIIELDERRGSASSKLSTVG